MKSREQKQKELAALRAELEKSPALFITGYEKMTVQQDYELRKTIRGVGGDYQIVKNNIADKASENLPSSEVLNNLKGMTSVAFTTEDPVALAKALIAYAKTTPAFTFKAGFVEGRAIDIKSINDLATMPSKEELVAKVMFLINSSAQRLAVSLNGVARNMAVALNEAIKEEKFPQG
ncbi:MAG: 50S ribosomal protein L10 [Bryobacteraceae bacterium]|nr:50S ribosomal protein L10 [Bryobacteraceae bacterium]